MCGRSLTFRGVPKTYGLRPYSNVLIEKAQQVRGIAPKKRHHSRKVKDLPHIEQQSCVTPPQANSTSTKTLSFLLGHARCHAMLFQIRLEHLSNHRVFVRVINHVAAGMKAHGIQAMSAAAATHSLDPV